MVRRLGPPGRRTYRRCGVGPGEEDPLSSNLIQIGRGNVPKQFIQTQGLGHLYGPFYCAVRPHGIHSQIVDDYQDDVWPRLRSAFHEKRGENEEPQPEHGLLDERGS